MSKDSTMDNDFLELLHWFQGLGIGVMTKGEVAFKLNYFERKYEFFSDSEIFSRIISHYRFQVIQQTYKLLFGVDLLGNPAKIAVDMASGVKDFFYEPYQDRVRFYFCFVLACAFTIMRQFSNLGTRALRSQEKTF